MFFYDSRQNIYWKKNTNLKFVNQKSNDETHYVIQFPFQKTYLSSFFLYRHTKNNVARIEGISNAPTITVMIVPGKWFDIYGSKCSWLLYGVRGIHRFDVTTPQWSLTIVSLHLSTFTKLSLLSIIDMV